MTSKTFTTDDVKHIAKLANIPITPEEEKKLASGFTTTMSVVDDLFKVNVTNIAPTHQVTGLENITREDVVDTERMFTQDQALLNADKSYNGFFMIDQVIDQE
jgi:aspartyl/glutamyl-tRNA(Asn/Gln) amidotransferase C subunit